MRLEPNLRRNARGRFTAWVELGVGGEWHIARARDLSPGGMGVVLGPPHPELGGGVESEFHLPESVVALLVPAVVAWSDPSSQRLGLSFQDVDPAVAELLQSYVDTLDRPLDSPT